MAANRLRSTLAEVSVRQWVLTAWMLLTTLQLAVLQHRLDAVADDADSARSDAAEANNNTQSLGAALTDMRSDIDDIKQDVSYIRILATSR